jgi:hypothetical protein
MVAIQTGGRAAADEQLAAIKGAVPSLELASELGALRTWSAPLDRNRLLEVSVSVGGHILTTQVSYRLVKPVRLTKQQERAAALQAAFYSRYESIGRIAYRDGAKPRLTSKERIILMIGELEADVNNGGFAQYLENKGKRRARAALRALATVGATRTARWLESALEPGVTSEKLERLDAHFCDHPDDLACLVMRALSAHEKKESL